MHAVAVTQHLPWNVGRICKMLTPGNYFRCVFVFEDISSPQLSRPPPCPVKLSDEKIAELLRLYNDSWRDNSFRDLGVEPQARYSQFQQEYFATKPEQRWELVRERERLA